MLALSARQMKIGLTALTLRPACLIGVLFVKKKENRLRLIVDCREANALFAPPPPVELLSGDGLSRIEVDFSGLVRGESLRLHYGCADVADCCHRVCLSGDSQCFLLARGVEQVPQHDGSRGDQSFVQSNSLADALFVTDGFLLESPLRSVRQSDTIEKTAILRHSGEMMDRGPPLVLSK